MKLMVFTKGDGPETREVKDLANIIEEEGYEVELIDVEEDEPRQVMEVYDIYMTPAFAVCQDDGKLVEVWRGDSPTQSELLNFMRS